MLHICLTQKLETESLVAPGIRCVLKLLALKRGQVKHFDENVSNEKQCQRKLRVVSAEQNSEIKI